MQRSLFLCLMPVVFALACSDPSETDPPGNGGGGAAPSGGASPDTSSSSASTGGAGELGGAGGAPETGGAPTTGGGGEGGGEGGHFPGEAFWSKLFGTSVTGYRGGRGIAVDAEDATIVIGHMNDDHGKEAPCTVTFGATPALTADGADAFVAKLDESGVVLWRMRLSADASGNADDDVIAADVAVDELGNSVVVGSFRGDWTIDGASHDAGSGARPFALALDPSGQILWFNAFSGSGGLRTVSIDPQGDIVIAGYSDATNVNLGGGTLAADNFVGKLAPDGSHLWSVPLSLGEVGVLASAIGPDGEIALTGGQTTGADDVDAWLRLLGPNGTELWTKTFAGPQSQRGRGVVFEANGALVLDVWFESSISFGGDTFTTAEEAFAIAKLGADGAHVYSRAVGPVRSSSIGVDPTGNLYALVTGDNVPLDFGLIHTEPVDALVMVKLDPSGVAIWGFVSGLGSSGHAVAVGSSGALRITGDLTESMDLGAGVLNPVGAHGDIVVAAYPP
ncbi:MAG: hypothetical protein HOW73_51230 [Polyangiaceae bacterium]|nr:hypothetical protein [Polyangiaceae bacterium]